MGTWATLSAVCLLHVGRQILRILTAPTSPCMQMAVARYSLSSAPMAELEDVLAASLRSPPYDDIAASTHILLKLLSPAVVSAGGTDASWLSSCLAPPSLPSPPCQPHPRQ